MAIFFLYSCSKDVEPISESDQEAVENEAFVEYAFEDIDDMATVSLAVAESSSGGRTTDDGEGEDDNRWKGCATFTHDSTGEYSGVITIDFGDGCKDLRGRIRKGKIIITYDGRRFIFGSSISITLENYSIIPHPDHPDFEIQLEGTRTIENITESSNSPPTFHITLTGGKATFPDGSTATREVDRTRSWIRATNPLNDEWHVNGNASGTNRNGVEYQVNIDKTLVFKRACRLEKVFIPVSGIKLVTIGDREFTVDFGDGECDNTVTVTSNGASKEIDLAKR